MGDKHDHDDHHHGGKTPIVAFALYKPKPGKSKELEALIARHIPTRRELELVTDRAPVLVRSTDGTFIEVFEWRSGEAIGRAHQHPRLAMVWEAMGAIADFPPLSALPEANERFPGFAPVDLGAEQTVS
jgi:quinol monooxygenase YgiN